jgi:hypothetical protein
MQSKMNIHLDLTSYMIQSLSRCSTPNYKCFYGVESPYKCQMLVCNHRHEKSFAESTYTPAILSPRSRSGTGSHQNDGVERARPRDQKTHYQMWLQLVHRLRERASALNPRGETRSSSERFAYSSSQHSSPSLGLQREKTWAGHESITPWHNMKLNSNRQVIALMNRYSYLLSAEPNEQLAQGFQDRPKSILRPLGSPNKYRYNKEVTFAAE